MTDSPIPVEARQRAVAEARVRFARAGARTEAAGLYETGGLRLRFPNAAGRCEAAIINTAGGVAGGDQLSLALSLGPGAEVAATTPAAEKIYRSDGPPARLTTRLELAGGARLAWAPQETMLYEGASLTRRLEADIAADSELVVVESLVFGRLASGETRIDATLHDSWRLRRGGRLVFAEETRLQRAGAALDRPAVGKGARASALVLAAAPEIEARLAQLRAALEGEPQVEAGASAFDGILVARLLSAQPNRLRTALIAAMLALGLRPPRPWG